LLVGADREPAAAFAVTRHHHGSVSLTINRATSIVEVNRKLAAWGSKRSAQAGNDRGRRSVVDPQLLVDPGGVAWRVAPDGRAELKAGLDDR
jgi:hypothetical protein